MPTSWTNHGGGTPGGVIYLPHTDVTIVSLFKTGGIGTDGDPWTGWDTAITWLPFTQYYFPKGVYAYATAPNWALQGIRIIGEGGTTLRHTGAGNAVLFSEPDAGEFVFDCHMQDFRIEGNALTTTGLWIEGVCHSSFKRIRIFNVADQGVAIQAAIENIYEFVTIHKNELAPPKLWTVEPDFGFVMFDRISDGVGNTSSIFSGCGVNGVANAGYWIFKADFCTFINANSEGNPKGFVLATTAVENVFIACDAESNSGNGWEVAGRRNTWINPRGNDPFVIQTNALDNTIHGGYLDVLTIEAGALRNAVRDTVYGNLGGAFTDSGSGTSILNVKNASGTPVQSKIRSTETAITGALAVGGDFAPKKDANLTVIPSASTIPAAYFGDAATGARPLTIITAANASFAMNAWRDAGGWKNATANEYGVLVAGGNNGLQIFQTSLNALVDQAVTLTELLRVQVDGFTRVLGNGLVVGSLGTSPQISSGTGTPEGAVAAPVGSIRLRTDGGAGTTLYVKESGGATSTGWVAK